MASSGEGVVKSKGFTVVARDSKLEDWLRLLNFKNTVQLLGLFLISTRPNDEAFLWSKPWSIEIVPLRTTGRIKSALLDSLELERLRLSLLMAIEHLFRKAEAKLRLVWTESVFANTDGWTMEDEHDFKFPKTLGFKLILANSERVGRALIEVFFTESGVPKVNFANWDKFGLMADNEDVLETIGTELDISSCCWDVAEWFALDKCNLANWLKLTWDLLVFVLISYLREWQMWKAIQSAASKRYETKQSI